MHVSYSHRYGSGGLAINAFLGKNWTQVDPVLSRQHGKNPRPRRSCRRSCTVQEPKIQAVLQAVVHGAGTQVLQAVLHWQSLPRVRPSLLRLGDD